MYVMHDLLPVQKRSAVNLQSPGRINVSLFFLNLLISFDLKQVKICGIHPTTSIDIKFFGMTGRFAAQILLKGSLVFLPGCCEVISACHYCKGYLSALCPCLTCAPAVKY
jgi:hypothetical protein